MPRPHAPRPNGRQSLRAVMDALEPRRLLTFVGNSNVNDHFIITFEDFGSIRVDLNGVELGRVNGSLSIDGLGSFTEPDRFEFRTDGINFPSGRRTILLEGNGPLRQEVFYGTATDRVFTLSMDVELILLAPANIEVHHSSSSTTLFTDSGGTEQRLFSGSNFAMENRSQALSNLSVFGASTGHTFKVAGVSPFTSLEMIGGAGNDLLETINVGGVDGPFDNDLDAVFTGGSLATFDGAGGNDVLDLTDTADQLGDVDDYYLRDSTFAKANFGGTPLSLLGYSSIERVLLSADGDNNRIFFDTSSFADVEIFGNAGVDTFVNRSQSAPIDSLANTLAPNLLLDGGSGNDLLSLTDAAGASAAYQVQADRISYDSATDAVVRFNSIGEVELTTSGSADSLNITSRPAGTTLDIDVGGGNDSISIGGGDLDSNGFLAPGVTVTGGSGSDQLTFDDRLDTDTAGEAENYTLTNNTLAKGALSFNAGSFEAITLLAADGIVPGQFNTTPNINVNSTSATQTDTRVIGGAARGAVVNVSQGNLAAIVGPLSLDTISTVNINDQSAGGVVSIFEVTTAHVRKPDSGCTIEYAAVGQIVINASDVIGDFVLVNALSAGTALTVNGNAGNDQFTLGGGDVSSQVLGTTVFNGGAGSNLLTINNNLDTAPATQTLRSTSYTDALHHTFAGFESLILNGGPGGTNLRLESTTARTTINGGSGSDSFSVGGGDIDANLPAGTSATPSVVIDGMAGSDVMSFDDRDDAGIDNYFFQRPTGTDQFGKRSAGIDYFVSFAGLEGVTLEASNAATTAGAFTGITVTDLITPLRIHGNGGNDFVQVHDAAAPIVVHTGIGNLDRVDINADLDGQPVTVVVEESDDVETLNVLAGATLRVGTDAVLAKTRNQTPLAGALTVSGTIDLAGGAMISRTGGGPAPTPAFFRQLLTRGQAGGAWNGTSASGAIHSTLAAGSTQSDGVGYGLGSEAAVTTIGGFTLAAGDTLIRYTLEGDADLNQQVGIADFARLAANFNGSNKVWTTGDGNYDGTTGIGDFAALAANFNQAVGAASRVPWAAPRAGSAMGGRFSDRLIELLAV